MCLQIDRDILDNINFGRGRVVHRAWGMWWVVWEFVAMLEHE